MSGSVISTLLTPSMTNGVVSTCASPTTWRTFPLLLLFPSTPTSIPSAPSASALSNAASTGTCVYVVDSPNVCEGSTPGGTGGSGDGDGDPDGEPGGDGSPGVYGVDVAETSVPGDGSGGNRVYRPTYTPSAGSRLYPYVTEIAERWLEERGSG